MSVRRSSGVLGSRDPLVSFGVDSFDCGDLVLIGFVNGSWQEFERLARAGLALDRGSSTGDADPNLVRAAAVAFRRAHGLVAGDELRAWLAERGRSMPEWTSYLRRLVLRQRSREALDDALARHPVPDDDVAALLESEIAFDGVLHRCATAAVEWSAAASSPVVAVGGRSAEPGPSRVAAHAHDVSASVARGLLNLEDYEVRGRLTRVIKLREAYERFVRATWTDRSILGCLDEHRIDWLRFRCLELRTSGQAAAREALLCLREDGMKPAEVARLASAELNELSIELAGVGPSLASLLLSADTGDVVGPLAEADGRTRLLVVIERVPPSSEDTELVERARAEVLRAGLQPLVEGMVRWHGDF